MGANVKPFHEGLEGGELGGWQKLEDALVLGEQSRTCWGVAGGGRSVVSNKRACEIRGAGRAAAELRPS